MISPILITNAFDTYSTLFVDDLVPGPGNRRAFAWWSIEKHEIPINNVQDEADLHLGRSIRLQKLNRY